MRVHHDSELMEQVVAASPLADVRDFHVVRDHKRRPIIFSISKKGVLYLIKPDKHGHHEPISISDELNIPSDHEVTALGVHQDATDLTLSVAFAHGKPHQRSELVLLKEMTPDTLIGCPLGCLADYVMPGQSGDFDGHVYDLLLSPGVDKHRPLAVATSHPPQPINADLWEANSDICRIDIDYQASTWSIKRDLRIPFNSADVYCICPGSLPGNMVFGVFALFTVAENLCLYFLGLSPGQGGRYRLEQIKLPVPPEARDLSTVETARRKTDLLIAAKDGIYRIPADACTSGLTELPSHSLIAANRDCFQGLQQIQTLQSQYLVSIFTRNTNGDIGHIQFLTLDEGVGRPMANSPTLTKATDAHGITSGAAQFRALRDEATGSQLVFALLSNGEDMQSAMRTLHQSGDSELWTTGEFLIPSSDMHREIYTYTTTIRVEPTATGDGKLFDGKLELSASSACLATVNGQNVHLSQQPIRVKPDAIGMVTVIQQINDLHVPVLRVVTGVPGSEPTYIDPSRKVFGFFKSLSTAGDLQSANFPNGEKLLGDAATPRSVDAGRVMETIARLTACGSSLKPEDHFAVAGSAPSDEAAHDASQERASASSTVQPHSSPGWSVFDWFTRVLHKINDIFLEGMDLIVRIGEKTWKFVVSTYEHVMKSIKKALEWLGVGVKKIWDGLKYIFAWKDIEDTHLILREYVATSLDVATGCLSLFGDQARDFLLRVADREMGDLTPQDLPTEAKNPLRDDAKLNNKMEEHANVIEAFYSPASNYANYHVQHNPKVIKAMRVPSGPVDHNDPLSRIWASLKDLMAEFWDMTKSVGSKLASLVSEPSGKVSISDLVSSLGKHLRGKLISALKRLVNLVFDFGHDVLLAVDKFARKQVDIPVISWLWGKISKAPLTLLDAVLLVLAIPSTIAFKICHGVKPKDHAFYNEVQSARGKMLAELFKIEEQYNTLGHPSTSLTRVKRAVQEQTTNSATSSTTLPAADISNNTIKPGPGILLQQIDRVSAHPLLRWFNKWLAAHQPLATFGYLAWNFFFLFKETGEWKESLDEAADVESGRKWDTCGAVTFTISWVFSFPMESRSPSWYLQVADWAISFLAIAKHGCSHVVNGAMTFVFALLQIHFYTKSWRMDYKENWEKRDDVIVIASTYFAKIHDALSGFCTTINGSNPHLAFACSTSGMLSIFGTGFDKARKAEVGVCHLIFRT
ncbi:hypothetical protein B0T20DRAFT_494908 [Sordaria brevicollis]|uniref:Uncharacterized protein n=1 Tax=Sordaria brevicollis TaxID=83679 RepID=A0AAE0PJT9_SORBR|nr:hypothetical protein B0T20DRAFT_494908 [Sordaria brevicollis]